MYVLVGVELLRIFEKEYAEMEKRRQELTNAEKLFDLQITMYPAIIEVDSELKNLAKIFKIYEDQKVIAIAFHNPYSHSVKHPHFHFHSLSF